MNLDLMCEEVMIQPQSRAEIELSLIGVDKELILRQFTFQDLVDAFDAEDLLEAIGRDTCMHHFDLVSA